MRIPPSIGIELRMAAAANCHFGSVAFHGAAKRSTEAACVIGSAYHNDGVKPLLIAPSSKYWAFVLCAGYVNGYLLDTHKSQSSQFSDISVGSIFEWNAATGELSFRRIPSVGEN